MHREEEVPAEHRGLTELKKQIKFRKSDTTGICMAEYQSRGCYVEKELQKSVQIKTVTEY